MILNILGAFGVVYGMGFLINHFAKNKEFMKGYNSARAAEGGTGAKPVGSYMSDTGFKNDLTYNIVNIHSGRVVYTNKGWKIKNILMNHIHAPAEYNIHSIFNLEFNTENYLIVPKFFGNEFPSIVF